MSSSHTSLNNNNTGFVWVDERRRLELSITTRLSATSNHMGQLPKQFPVLQSVVVSHLAGQQLIIHGCTDLSIFVEAVLESAIFCLEKGHTKNLLPSGSRVKVKKSGTDRRPDRRADTGR